MSTATTNMSLSANDIFQKILESKGKFVKVRYKSNPSPKAEFKGTNLEKITTTIIQAGVAYENLSAVKTAIQEGTRPAEIGPLPFGNWKVYPYIIEHTNKDNEYCEYVRLYPSQGNNHKGNSIYYVEGKEVTKDEFASFLTPSEAKKLLDPKPEDVPLCYTVKAQNILGIPEEV